MIIESHDIPDQEVRNWFLLNRSSEQFQVSHSDRPKCLYIGTPGLGEMVGQSPIWREMHSRGYDVILICREEISAAFDTLPFVSEVWSSSEMHMRYNGKVFLSDLLVKNIKENINSPGCILISPVLNKTNLMHMGTKPDNKDRLATMTNNDSVASWARATGVALSDQKMQIGYRRTHVAVQTSNNVAICVGSFDTTRKLSSETIERLCYSIQQANIFLIGPFIPGLNVSENVNTDLLISQKLGMETLRETLSCLEKMDVVITTDTGLMYCAIAMNKPVICLESRTLIDGFLIPTNLEFVKVLRADCSILTCDQSCHARKILNYLRQQCKSIQDWNDAILEQNIFPTNALACKDGHSVECLRKLDFENVSEFVANYLVKKQRHSIIDVSKFYVDDPQFEAAWANISSRQRQFVDFATPGHGSDFTCIGQSKQELQYFLNTIKPLNLKLGMEIGCWYGGSHFMLQTVVPTMISMDIDHGRLILAKKLCNTEKSHFIHANSCIDDNKSVVQSLLNMLGFKYLDMLFIDGNHSYEACKKDHTLYSPLVRPGGVVAFHDSISFGGVVDFIKELENDGYSMTTLKCHQGTSFYRKLS